MTISLVGILLPLFQNDLLLGVVHGVLALNIDEVGDHAVLLVEDVLDADETQVIPALLLDQSDGEV